MWRHARIDEVKVLKGFVVLNGASQIHHQTFVCYAVRTTLLLELMLSQSRILRERD